MDKLISLLFSNLQYKLTAIMLGCALWYFVQGEEILEINRRIQVELEVPDGYVIEGPRVLIKDATLRGPRAYLAEFSTRPLEAKVEVPKKIGKFRPRLDKEHFLNWNQRIRLTIHDAYLNLMVDQKTTRTVPIREHLIGVPADGYMIERAMINPNTVTISGSRAVVNKMSSIMTEAIDINGLQQTKRIEASLEKSQSVGLKLSVERVSVNLLVGEKKVNKRFGSIPVEVEGCRFPYNVRPHYVSVVIQGTPGVLSFVKRSQLRAFINARDLQPGKYDKKIMVKIPPETTLIEVFPSQALLEVSQE